MHVEPRKWNVGGPFLVKVGSSGAFFLETSALLVTHQCSRAIDHLASFPIQPISQGWRFCLVSATFNFFSGVGGQQVHILRCFSRVILLIAISFFASPSCLQAGLVFVADYGADSILRVEGNGSVSVFASGGMSGPTGMAIDSRGNFYVANSNDGTVRKFSSSGTDLGVFATSTSSLVSGIAIDSQDNVYVGDWSPGNGEIRRYAPDGTDLGVFAQHSIDELPNAFGPSSYFAMSFDPFGSLWAVDDFFGRLYKFSTDGVNLLDVRLGDTFAMAIADSGDVYVHHFADGNYGIQRFSNSGDDLGFIARDIEFATGMTFDEDGNLLVSYFDSGSIHRFSTDGQDLGTFASGLSAPTSLISIQAVPEPSTWAIGLLAITSFVARRQIQRIRNRVG